MFNSGSQITVGSVLGGTENWSGDVFEAGLGASTSSMYDYSHFDADQINRHQWRIDNTVDTGQGPTGETWTVTYTDSAEDANDPPIRWHYGRDYAYTHGSSSNSLSATLNAGVANGSTVSVRADVAPDDATPSGNRHCVSQSFGLNLSTTGAVRYTFSGSLGSAAATSSVVLPIVDGQDVQIRADHDSTNDTVDFYYRFGTADLTGDTGWTALGVQQAITNDDFHANTVSGAGSVSLGDGGTQWDGKLYRGVLIDDGTVVWNADVSDASADGTSFTDSVTGNTVTINRATSGFATEIVKAPTWLHGDSHWVDIPHDPIFNVDLSAAGAISVAVNCRMHAQGTTGKRLFDKRGTGTGWALSQNTTGPKADALWDDGVDSQTTSSPDYTSSTRTTILAAAVDGDQETYAAGVGGTATTSTAVDNMADTGVLRVGSQNNAATNVLGATAMFAVAILSKRVTDAEALAIHNELVAA